MRSQILVIDENVAVFNAVFTSLSKDNFDVLGAQTQQAGLESAQDKKPAVIIISNSFNIDNYIDKLKEASENSYIILSVQTYIQYLDAASSNNNIQNYLLKPIDANVLADAIQLALESKHSDGIESENSTEHPVYGDMSPDKNESSNVQTEKLNIESRDDFSIDLNSSEEQKLYPDDTPIAAENITSGKSQENKLPVDEVQESKFHVEEVQEDKLPVDEMQESKLPVDEVQEDKLPVDEMQESKLPVDEVQESKLPVDEMQEDKLPLDEMQEDKLPLDEMQEDKLPLDEMQEDKLPVEEVQESKLPVEEPQNYGEDSKTDESEVSQVIDFDDSGLNMSEHTTYDDTTKSDQDNTDASLSHQTQPETDESHHTDLSTTIEDDSEKVLPSFGFPEFDDSLQNKDINTQEKHAEDNADVIDSTTMESTNETTVELPNSETVNTGSLQDDLPDLKEKNATESNNNVEQESENSITESVNDNVAQDTVNADNNIKADHIKVDDINRINDDVESYPALSSIEVSGDEVIPEDFKIDTKLSENLPEVTEEITSQKSNDEKEFEQADTGNDEDIKNSSIDFPLLNENQANEDVTPDSVLFNDNENNDYATSVPKENNDKDYVTIPEAEKIFGVDSDSKLIDKISGNETLSDSEEDELLSELYSLLAEPDNKPDEHKKASSAYKYDNIPSPEQDIQDTNNSYEEATNQESLNELQSKPFENSDAYKSEESNYGLHSEDILTYFGDDEDSDEKFLQDLNESAHKQEKEERHMLTSLFGEAGIYFDDDDEQQYQQSATNSKISADNESDTGNITEQNNTRDEDTNVIDNEEYTKPLDEAVIDDNKSANKPEPEEEEQQSVIRIGESKHEPGGQHDKSSTTGFKKMAEILIPKESNSNNTSASRGGWLSIDLSKDEISELLSKTIDKSELKIIIKDVVRESISSSVERLLPQIAEQIVREELELLKSSK